jgi:hypothetical protein
MNRSFPLPRFSAYGLTFLGITSQLPGRDAQDWEEVLVTTRQVQRRAIDRDTTPAVGLDDEHGWASVLEGELAVRRQPELAIEWNLLRPLQEEAMVHPYLALPASMISHWLGRTCLHGGAIAVDGGAVAVVGSREAGKSSTIVAAAAAGHHILSDDLVVIDDACVLAGPRSIDLRAETAKKYGGIELGVIGGRERWRLACPPGPASLPLAGIVRLEWADEVELVPLSATERIATLYQHRYTVPGPATPTHFLDLASLPAVEIRRPRRLDVLPEVLSLIVEFFSDVSEPAALG